ncbi:hypothetical protein [Streptomonospora litoralis]|uniref:Uncharacterized protein n=1 Tax=Streptomonospora litoralis TaxID=2498135 RepID=A0A4P6PYF0_9ACTN|nr:hypothetical protein [Streptomonospora litoralis]QBI53185.1 hypothetical protein EKD16_06945 [Streptomonospora litoralis]
MELYGGRPEDTVPRRSCGASAAGPPLRGRGAGERPDGVWPSGTGACGAYRAYDAADGGYGALALTEEETAAQILLRGLVDDAGLCPPGARHVRSAGSASPDARPLRMVQAVERHRSDRIVGHPMLAHRLLCPASRWPDLLRRLDGSWPVDVALLLDTDAGRAGELPERDPRVRVAHYETRARPDDLRLVAELFRSGDIGVAGRVVYFEPAREPGWLDAVDILSGARPLGAKLRCGGPRFELVPGVREIGAFITACVERDVPFVVTAGLHQAAGDTDPLTRAPRYGYLNLLLATAAVVEGDHDDVADLLSCTDAEQLARLAQRLHPVTALRTRELLVGYASRSTGDPLREAAALGLLGAWEV